jgi:arylsulfatase A-like enzyme
VIVRKKYEKRFLEPGFESAARDQSKYNRFQICHNNMIKRTLLLLGIALVSPVHAAPAPNIVLMLADDLGWQDVACYDIDEPSPMETPNIDALAKRGKLFRQGYSPAPSCTPSRCAIMSGNHPARAQTTHVSGGSPPRTNHKDRLITPWFSGRMPENELSLAKILRQHGYATGHTGKWHMAKDHYAFPGPLDQGFEFTSHRSGFDARGVQTAMKNRLEGFATDKPGDPYRLDADGFPTDPVTTAALDFMAANKDKPFFLYYATWLVHTPIQSRSKALVEKYCRKLGIDFPADPGEWPLKGQRNPYYCGMVETLDHYVGRLVEFLETTDDPRNPGHKLIDNTYIFFTSDNGGMETSIHENITDNAPLDRGKMSPKEGGVRVPFLIAGPGIPAGRESDVMVNGLDFYPTILSMAGIAKPDTKNLDGADLLPSLTGVADDPTLVLDQHGKPRTEMVWHYPHGGDPGFQSTIRTGDFKLIRNEDTRNSTLPPLELYRLVDSKMRKQMRVDIEEAKNLAGELPEQAAAMNARLTKILTEMNASLPYWNPESRTPLSNQKKVPAVTGYSVDGHTVTATYKENGARVVRADVIYAINVPVTSGREIREWFRMAAGIDDGVVKATLPPEATHAYINVIDENNFLVSHPKPVSDPKNGDDFAGTSIALGNSSGPASKSGTR